MPCTVLQSTSPRGNSHDARYIWCTVRIQPVMLNASKGEKQSRANAIRVWAPLAGHVAVQLNGLEREMVRGDLGWWELTVPEPLHGADYEFILDGGRPLPDPRSASQPYGVHGKSRFIDHRRFNWEDHGWQPPLFRCGIVYELHIGTFTPEGTFESAIERLDHLVALGVTHVELMPVAEFPGDRGWGYDGVDLYAPHHAYGGPDGLKRLVNACHLKGLAVILDVVYNHLGPDGNYLAQFGPYFSDRHHTPWGQSVNLDGEESEEVRRFFCDNALMWLRDYHFDGLRLDAIHALLDTSAVHFLEQLAVEVDRLEAELGRTLILIAESDLNDPRVVQSRDIGGYGITAQWSDDFHHALHVCLTGERRGYYSDFGTVADLAKALTKAFVYDGRYSEYRKRPHGRPPRGVPAYRLVVCLQNHDQIGNRPRGERSSHLMSAEGLLVGAAVLLTAPFVPMLFQGEEWGASTPFQFFTGHEDPNLARAVSEGRRREYSIFGWRPEEIPDPQARATFENSKLKWSEMAEGPHHNILEAHRKLIQLRRSSPSLNDRRPARVEVEDSTLRVTRGDVSLVCHFRRDQPSVTVRVNDQVVFSSQEEVEFVDAQPAGGS
ncbi:MAG: treZ [Bryobacterales bacterium]|nr:treZ [Bryobacterales bacterium]